MNSKERLLTTLNHQEPDHTPLLAWCFGFTAPPHLRWQQDGQEIVHWYTGRLEHIHTLPLAGGRLPSRRCLAEPGVGRCA